ncbi:MAG: hypothetical protein QM770_05720 [Tepidisphaeraceae bacterium]
MSADNTPAAATGAAQSPQSVQLFQRAHQKMVMLQRVDDQIQTLLNQRRSVQDELRGIQVQINEEFDRLLRAGNGGAPTRLLAEIADDFKRGGTNGSTEARVAELAD